MSTSYFCFETSTVPGIPGVFAGVRVDIDDTGAFYDVIPLQYHLNFQGVRRMPILIAGASPLMLNAEDYGFLPSATASVNTSALTAAIAAASSGGMIMLPAGVYNYNPFTITKSGVSLIGAGAGATILTTPAGSENVAPLIIGDGTNTCADVQIADIQFTSTNQKTANACIKLQKCFRTHLDRIRFQNQYRGLHVFNSTETWLTNSDIRDTSENAVVYEATVGNGYDLYLTNITADNPVATNSGSGIYWVGGENFVIQNCDFLHFQTGLNITPPTGQQCRFGFFTDAEFDTCSDNTIKISSSGGDIVGLTFMNTWSGTATNYGVLIDGGSGGTTQGVRFIGHKSFHNGLAGIRLAGGLDMHLLGCDVVGNSQTVANSRNNIEIASTSLTGSIIGCRSTNGFQQGATSSNGINLDNASGYTMLIANNDLRGNTNNALALNGATGNNLVIRGNQGHNPVGKLTAPSVPSSTTVQTNNLGYDCMVLVSGGTVSAIAVGGQSTGQTSGWFRVPASQTITLTYTVAPTWTWWAD